MLQLEKPRIYKLSFQNKSTAHGVAMQYVYEPYVIMQGVEILLNIPQAPVDKVIASDSITIKERVRIKVASMGVDMKEMHKFWNPVSATEHKTIRKKKRRL